MKILRFTGKLCSLEKNSSKIQSKHLRFFGTTGLCWTAHCEETRRRERGRLTANGLQPEIEPRTTVSRIIILHIWCTTLCTMNLVFYLLTAHVSSMTSNHIWLCLEQNESCACYVGIEVMQYWCNSYTEPCSFYPWVSKIVKTTWPVQITTRTHCRLCTVICSMNFQEDSYEYIKTWKMIQPSQWE